MSETTPSVSEPPKPVYIFRGHSGSIHSLTFLRNNSRLISGDSEGWAIIWSLATKRPTSVWKAHDSSLLKVEGWGSKRLITHGRDGKIHVWELKESDEEFMSTQLPVDNDPTHRKQPWALHSLSVASLNFCAFASYKVRIESDITTSTGGQNLLSENTNNRKLGSLQSDALLLAVAGKDESTVEVYELPTEKQVAFLPSLQDTKPKPGMVMAISLFHHNVHGLVIATAYESGHTAAFKQAQAEKKFECIYMQQAHNQPVLSLDVSFATGTLFSSGADDVVARHTIPSNGNSTSPVKTNHTRHSGQQGLQVRSDGKIFATAGWDGRGRVYSAKTAREVAVLKWHQNGCYAVSFAEVLDTVTAQGKDAAGDANGQLVQQKSDLIASRTVAQIRDEKARSTHWLALGSKDGKISLWDVY